MTNYRSLPLIILTILLAVPARAAQNAEKPAAGEQTAAAGSEAKESAQPKPSEYVIGPQDELDISVWKEPDLSRKVPVRPDGKISLPLLNDVQAAGLTPTQLADSIKEMLRKYVTQPQVTVIVTAMNSQRIFVLGEVNKPGALQLLPGMTVIQAIASAGSFTQFANEKKIYVLRDEGGKQNRYFFNYKLAIRGDTSQNIDLKPGDTIVVP
jgi:polysaccharide export outer membrane protein